MKNKKNVLLFQPYLRKHILDFEKVLKNFKFTVASKKFANSKSFYKKSMQSPEKEFSRTKITWFTKIRRLLGILNVRPKFTTKGDLLFTYGCLLITNKPYCVYIENGAALFNYDAAILRNPLAKIFFSILIRLPQCKKLIFMSETAKKSLLSTGNFSKSTTNLIEKKSEQIYPYTKDPKINQPKKRSETLKLLFTGIYYAKGGRELVNAFREVTKLNSNVKLTIVTPLHMLLKEDSDLIKDTPGIKLLDASLSPPEMDSLYKENDVFVFPTVRDTFGLVLIEAISFGMPIIATDQYATTEMAIENYNAFVFENHPLIDYNTRTKKMYGHLYDAKVLYQELFSAQEKGLMRPLEEFIAQSIEKFLNNPNLLKKYSTNSLNLYNKKFKEENISNQIESVFLEATK